MAKSTNYVNVKIDEEARNQGRVTKAKLGITWTEFVSRTANKLDHEEPVHG